MTKNADAPLVDRTQLRLVDASEVQSDPRPPVQLGPDEHRVVDEVIRHLAADEHLYQRGGILVRTVTLPDAAMRGTPPLQIVPVAQAYLRDRITKFVRLRGVGKKTKDDDGKPKDVHPPTWLVAAIDARRIWPGIRILRGVTDAPFIRSDGAVVQDAGFDEASGVIYRPTATFPTIDPDVDEDDADAAMEELFEVVCDFRFVDGAHQAAWLAGLLTPIARFAFHGPAPLFLFDANVRGAGKGLLVQTIANIVLGSDVPVSSYSGDSEEMRKRITTLAMCGDRFVLLDNLDGSLGNDALDRALTANLWRDRILGKNEQVEAPLLATWYATGNNVQVRADTARRIVHCRLDVLSERPEEREGFTHPDLLGWVRENRPRLYMAALKILAAYIRRGRPRQKVTSYGSYEGWSDLVRQAVVWLGLPDPCSTRLSLEQGADETVEALSALLDALEAYDPHATGVVISDLMRNLYNHGSEGTAWPTDEGTRLKNAIEGLIGLPPGRTPSSRQIAARFKKHRRRVINGRFLDYDASEYNRAGAVWRVNRTSTPDAASLRVCESEIPPSEIHPEI